MDISDGERGKSDGVGDFPARFKKCHGLIGSKGLAPSRTPPHSGLLSANRSGVRVPACETEMIFKHLYSLFALWRFDLAKRKSVKSIALLQKENTMAENTPVRVTSEKELGKALKDGADTIEIEGDLSKKVVRIKATGKVAWAVAIGAIAVAVAGILTAALGGGAPSAASAFAAPAAIAVLGAPVTLSAILIAVAAGGVGVLNSLRKYKIVSKDGEKLVIKK